MPDFIDEMIRSSPKWVLREVDGEKAAELARRTGYSEIVSRIARAVHPQRIILFGSRARRRRSRQ